MPVIKKKSAQTSCHDLVAALKKFVILLEEQDEEDAAAELSQVCERLLKVDVNTPAFKKDLETIVDAFTGDHELESYTLRRENAESKWTVAEELYIASTTVWNLTNRLLRSL